jgi:HD-GYP domain-containing protein (c-di-GMP phosphodiesterase class II)
MLHVDGEEMPLLSENEVYNLSIRKGTLTNEERDVINNHVTVSYNMLNKLPFPKKLKNVPLIAASHHKTVRTDENGKHGGYGAQEIMSIPMSIKDKLLAIADVFEALTASDRPYKKANSLNQSMRILSFMAKDDDLDRDLVKFFVKKDIHTQYANKHLDESQMDEITIDFDAI